MSVETSPAQASALVGNQPLLRLCRGRSHPQWLHSFNQGHLVNFWSTLPKKRMSAGAIFLDEDGRILLVNPTYKPPWEIPGGITEADESPLQCCIREVQEELGLTVAPERMLSVSYKPSRGERLENVQFIFWGGVLEAETIAQIQLPPDELSEFGFFELDEAVQRLSAMNGERVRRSIEILDTERTLYLEL